ncbi:hypothetical protein PV325_008026 [Microctonus aethiopoides]|nr:hypothetical protein PV325_008026 [Microctonus aethiopoides]
MISLIFVACLLAGSALGQPWLNRRNVMPMQSQYSSPNVPTYALYPCESRNDPNGEWVYVRNQQHYVHVAECQQYNGQNNCAYRSAQNYVHPQTQPMVYIQPVYDCRTQMCEPTCLRGSCFGGRVLDTLCQTGEPCYPTTTTTTPTPAPEPSTTTTTTTTTTTPAPEPTTSARSVEPITNMKDEVDSTARKPLNLPYYYYPYYPLFFNITQNQYSELNHRFDTQPKTKKPIKSTATTTTTTTTTPKPTVVSTTEVTSTQRPMKSDVTNSKKQKINVEMVECKTAHGCEPAPQQQIYYQPSSSSSAAAAAAASSGGSSASASASAAGGSASASASAAASSAPHMTFPGVPLQYSQQYRNQVLPCKSNSGSNPCEVQYKKSASVNQNGISIQVSEDNDDSHDAENQSPCNNSPCMQ